MCYLTWEVGTERKKRESLCLSTSGSMYTSPVSQCPDHILLLVWSQRCTAAGVSFWAEQRAKATYPEPIRVEKHLPLHDGACMSSPNPTFSIQPCNILKLTSKGSRPSLVNAPLTLGKMTVMDFQALIVWVECELGVGGRGGGRKGPSRQTPVGKPDSPCPLFIPGYR